MSRINLPHDHGHLTGQTLYPIPAKTDFQKTADLLQQLGDCNRVRLFWILCHCEECVINLSAMMDMSSPAISHHLRQLRMSGLIISHRDGKEVYYQAADTHQVRLLYRLVEQLIAISSPRTAGEYHPSAEGGAPNGGEPADSN